MSHIRNHKHRNKQEKPTVLVGGLGSRAAVSNVRQETRAGPAPLDAAAALLDAVSTPEGVEQLLLDQRPDLYGRVELLVLPEEHAPTAAATGFAGQTADDRTATDFAGPEVVEGNQTGSQRGCAATRGQYKGRVVTCGQQ